jgi:hypothetical protein
MVEHTDAYFHRASPRGYLLLDAAKADIERFSFAPLSPLPFNATHTSSDAA